MKSPRKWRSVGVAVLLAVAVPAVLSSASSVAQEEGLDGRSSSDWVGSWATALTGPEPGAGSAFNGFTNASLRMITHISIGGEKIRIRLSNVFGERTVTVGHATVARPNTSTPDLSDIDASTLHTLTFNGRSSTTMLKGQELLSDPVDFRVNDLEDLVISVFFPVASGPVSWHATSLQSSFATATDGGDLSATASGAGYTIHRDCCWYVLSGVDVLRHREAGAVVVVADSLGDGNGSTLNGNKRWPDLLAKRLVDTRRAGNVPGVLNASLAGNRLNHEGPEPGAGGFPGFVQLGTNAGARLNEDVFPQTGVRTVLFDLGINDIWMTGDSADAIIAAIRQAGSQVRERGLAFIPATLGPFEGFLLTPGAPAGEWTPAKEATRVAVNNFLRTTHEFDGLIDFDKVLRDPAAPSKLRAEFDSGDHIHPNDAGNQAMADLVPLRLLG
jgi:lysophospholipase L1-like esterase